jgi:MFS family permease
MEIGLAFLPVAVGMGAFSMGWSAKLIMRFGARAVLLVGLALIAGGLALLALGPMYSEYLRDLLLPLTLLGVGGGMAFPALTILAMADATPSDSGLASGVLNTTTQVGASLGLAVLATLSASRAGQLLGEGKSMAVAMSGGYHFAWVISMGLALAAIAISVFVLQRGAAAPAETVEMDAIADEAEPEEVCCA